MLKISTLGNLSRLLQPLLTICAHQNFHWEQNPILQFNHNFAQARYTATKYKLQEDEIYNLPQNLVKNHRIIQAYAHCTDLQNEGYQLIEFIFISIKTQSKSEKLKTNSTIFEQTEPNQSSLQKAIQIYDNFSVVEEMSEQVEFQKLVIIQLNYFPMNLLETVTMTQNQDILLLQISAMEDLIIEGYPTYTGKTTIEIRIDILQSGELKGTSRFLMASRKHGAKGNSIPQLQFTSESQQEQCLLRKQFGELHQVVRKKNQNLALDKFPPTESESKEIHEIFLDSRKYPNKYKTMKDSFLENNILLHVEDKNIHQNAFGGLIMRNGLDLALLSALRHFPVSDFPSTVHISDVLFISPIQINQIVNFKSQVTYVHAKSNLVNVFVGVNTISNKDGIKKNTRATELHFTFHCNNKVGKVSQIVPENYKEAMKFLESKRKLSAFL